MIIVIIILILAFIVTDVITLQVDSLKPLVSSFARDSLELLGCPRGQAATEEGRANLGRWLYFSPAGETLQCIKAREAGEVFDYKTVIAWCRDVLPQAKLTSVCHCALCTVHCSILYTLYTVPLAGAVRSPTFWRPSRRKTTSCWTRKARGARPDPGR